MKGFSFVQPSFTTAINGSTITITFPDTFAARTYTELQIDMTLDDLPTPSEWPKFLTAGGQGMYGDFSGSGSKVVATYQATGPSTSTAALFPSLQDLDSIFVPQAQAVLPPLASCAL